MKILLIGPGSIGARHLRNILSLGYSDIAVVSRSGVLSNEFSGLEVYTTIAGALASSTFDAAIICSPTSSHCADLRTVIEAQIPNIYLEKPVSHSLEGMDELLELSQRFSSKIVVGFDLHFDPGMEKVKSLIENRTIGNVISVNAVAGQYLPDWRPQEDYRKGMSASKEKGGGVMLDLVHEFDYVLWLMGNVTSVACQYSHSGSLEIETEDVCDVLLRFQNGATGTIHLDYLQPKLVRNCLITGSEGSISWDLAATKVSWITKQKEVSTFDYTGFERNDRFIKIMKAFLEQKEDERLTSFKEGLESLKLVLAAKYSSENNEFVSVLTFNPMPITV